MNTIGTANVDLSTINHAGVNLGYGNTKVRHDAGYFQFVSDSSPAGKGNRETFGMATDAVQRVQYKGDWYDVGEGACYTQSPRKRKPIFPFWAATTPYMVLCQAVLDRLALEGTDWWITLGVPITEMRDSTYTQRVRDLWVGEHQTAHGIIRIHRAFVAPEPSGALFHYGSTVVKDLSVLKQQALTVFDGGYFTTLSTTHRRMVADEANTIQIEHGVSRVVESIAEKLRRDFKEDRDVIEVEMAMLGKLQISVDGKEVDLTNYVREAVAQEGEVIVNKMRTEMPSPASRIYVVGGGAHLFGELFKQAYADKQVTVALEPQRVNADGLWLFTKYQREVAQRQQAA